MITIKSGEKTVQSHGPMTMFPNGHPGTICVAGNDLFDLGFKVKEINESGLMIQSDGPLDIKIERLNHFVPSGLRYTCVVTLEKDGVLTQEHMPVVEAKCAIYAYDKFLEMMSYGCTGHQVIGIDIKACQ